MRDDEPTDIVEVVWKRKWLILIVSIGAAAVGFLGSGRTPRTYVARVSLLLSPSESQVLANPAAVVDLIKNPSIAQRVVERFDLNKPPHDTDGAGFAREAVRVRTVRGTPLITLAVRLGDPRLAVAAVNSLAEEVVDVSGRMDRSNAELALQYVNGQRDRARRVLERERAALVSFRNSADPASLQAERDALLAEKQALIRRRGEIGSDEATIRTRIDGLTAVIKGPGSDRALTRSVQTGASPSEPAAAAPAGVRLSDEEVAAMRQHLVRELILRRVALSALEAERRSVEHRQHDNEVQLGEIGRQVDAMHDRLETLAESYSRARASYQLLAAKSDEALVSLGARAVGLRLVDKALVATEARAESAFLRSVGAASIAFAVLIPALVVVEYVARGRGRRGGADRRRP